MTPEQLKALQAEIAQTESTIRNLKAHSEQLAAEAAALEPHLTYLQSKLPKPGKA
jgi:cell division protein FtsB